jgi:hypothetical protein
LGQFQRHVAKASVVGRPYRHAIRVIIKVAVVVLSGRCIIRRANTAIESGSLSCHAAVLQESPGNRGGARHAYPADKQTDYAKRYEDILPHVLFLRFD